VFAVIKGGSLMISGTFLVIMFVEQMAVEAFPAIVSALRMIVEASPKTMFALGRVIEALPEIMFASAMVPYAFSEIMFIVRQVLHVLRKIVRNPVLVFKHAAFSAGKEIFSGRKRFFKDYNLQGCNYKRTKDLQSLSEYKILDVNIQAVKPNLRRQRNDIKTFIITA
jgi:hypothetical protein